MEQISFVLGLVMVGTLVIAELWHILYPAETRARPGGHPRRLDHPGGLASLQGMSEAFPSLSALPRQDDARL